MSSNCLSPYCASVSDDGSRVVFNFTQPLTADAPAGSIYVRESGVTRSLLDLPGDPNSVAFGVVGASSDAAHVFVSTSAALIPGDTDAYGDIYDVHDGEVDLVSTGPLDTPATGSAYPYVFFLGASPDGSRAFFDTNQQLLPDDQDTCSDIYERSGGETTLISTGPIAPKSFPPNICDLQRFGGVSRDGTGVFFMASGRMTEDAGPGQNIYQRVGTEVTSLTGIVPGPQTCVGSSTFADSSSDGRTVLFMTPEQISPEDLDGAPDAYLRLPDGSFELVSRGTDEQTQYCGDGSTGTYPHSLSADGQVASFVTDFALSAEDRDTTEDLYSARLDGPAELLTTGPTASESSERVGRAEFSDDLSVVGFETAQRLVAEDTDDSVDIYSRAGGLTSLVSSGPTGGNRSLNADLLGVSGNGQTIAFASRERLTTTDLDGAVDFYARTAVGLGSAGASRRLAPTRRSRTVLLSAESIAPKMGVARVVRRLGQKRLGLRITCPRTEKTGPCRGRVGLRTAKGLPLAGGRFRIRPGNGKVVNLRLKGRRARGLPPRAAARVIGADRLGNSKTVRRVVRLSD